MQPRLIAFLFSAMLCFTAGKQTSVLVGQEAGGFLSGRGS